MTNTNERDDLTVWSVCTDCLMLLVNDDTSGTPRCDTVAGEAAYRENVAACLGDARLVSDPDACTYFSWQPCEACGDRLGGMREDMVQI